MSQYSNIAFYSVFHIHGKGKEGVSFAHSFAKFAKLESVVNGNEQRIGKYLPKIWFFYFLFFSVANPSAILMQIFHLLPVVVDPDQVFFTPKLTYLNVISTASSSLIFALRLENFLFLADMSRVLGEN